MWDDILGGSICVDNLLLLLEELSKLLHAVFLHKAALKSLLFIITAFSGLYKMFNSDGKIKE